MALLHTIWIGERMEGLLRHLKYVVKAIEELFQNADHEGQIYIVPTYYMDKLYNEYEYLKDVVIEAEDV